MNKKYKMYKKPNIFQRNFSFQGCKERSKFWSDLGVQIIGLVCMSIILTIAVAVLIPGEARQLSLIVERVMGIVILVWLISVAAMTRRRLRDAGYSAKTYLWLLLPVIGWFVFVLRLCAKGSPEMPDEEQISYY